MDYPQFIPDDAELNSNVQTKRVSFIPAPLANTVSWIKGTDNGPEEIVKASAVLEAFDDELLIETYRAGFDTLLPLDFSGLSSQDACKLIYDSVYNEIKRDRLPVIIGGEHTVTIGAVEACLREHPNLHVVQFDAHLDLRHTYEDNTLSHACVMRRIYDMDVPFTQVGIRSFSSEEWKFITEKGMSPITIKRIRENLDWQEVFDELDAPVYITFDVDCLDPSVMPATGTPEPDGLSWDMARSILERIISTNKIVGMDFVEFAPSSGAPHAAFSVAKLLYRTLGYIYTPILSDKSFPS